ncbi:WD repeat-containing and planar cell polarity effector protein fritz [Drosophila guanche]|uniref:Blast:WD repeat-containing and planar cell polarity effector protein fritz n=1 Tax=Drosophila guanche TaxID=7266 RepID=A0A3B0K319_DROGU|nr:WD repeat-containing and planar cell polarity effector protein fritz [Drosophila guanche]SPP82300.1 blast:WD repeat-containing and planar cell polarity effector protein fritz [Drosophila guanche]
MLLSETHFWTTLRDEVRIKSNDLGAFRYMRQKEQDPDLTALAKRDYTERRNGLAVLKNSSRKSAGRLKDNLKKLEDLLRQHKVIHSEWQDAAQVLLLFANGIIAHICVDIYTGDILRMVFEKYLVGKLAAEIITDAFFTRSHIVLAYNTNQLTVVHLQRPNARSQGPEKIANMDPRIFHVIIPGATERKLSRHLTVNGSYDLFVVWTQSSQNEVYPWRPTVRDQDRANIHVFKIKGLQLESMAYCWSENDPLCVDFLRSSESQIITLEQKVSRKGEISAEICSYELATGKMQRTAITSIPMGAQICSFAFSPDQEKLFLGSIDQNICLHDLVLQTTKYVNQIEIVPHQCAWHCDSAMLCVANERSVLQCFDLALATIGHQLVSENVTPLSLLDLSHYFVAQPTLLNIAFSRKPDLSSFTHTYAQTDCLLLLIYEQGPLACMRIFGGAGMRGDIHNSGLTADVIADKYLRLQQPDRAVNVLAALNWETYGAMCLITLHKIANYVFFGGDQRRPRIELMARALKTFAHTLSEETKDEFSDQVYDLKRRFCFFLLRKNLFAEAFEIAQDVADYDLFMDLYNLTKCITSLGEFAQVSFSQAAAIIHEEDRANGNLSLTCDLRSESACSQSTCSELLRTGQGQPQALKNYVPPLPSFKSKIFNAEMIKINIPKPELRPPLPKLSIAPSNSLALLSLKSGSQQHQTPMKSVHSNGNVWSQDVPDQTVGLPMPSSPPPRPQAHPQLQPPPAISEQSSQLGLFNAPPPAAAAYQPKFYQHPLVSGNIPAMLPTVSSEEYQKRLLLKKPTASILSNPAAAPVNGEAVTPSAKSQTAEKNKVKFSDTIQVAVVPEIPRKEKPMPPKRNGYSRPAARHLTNPKKELADSLPLCHPHDDYLKDFNPINTNVTKPPTRRREDEQQKQSSQSKNASAASSSSSSIKVVHFGVV